MTQQKITSNRMFNVPMVNLGVVEIHYRKRGGELEIKTYLPNSCGAEMFPNRTINDAISNDLRVLNGFRKNMYVFWAAYIVTGD